VGLKGTREEKERLIALEDKMGRLNAEFRRGISLSLPLVPSFYMFNFELFALLLFFNLEHCDLSQVVRGEAEDANSWTPIITGIAMAACFVSCLGQYDRYRRVFYAVLLKDVAGKKHQFWTFVGKLSVYVDTLISVVGGVNLVGIYYKDFSSSAPAESCLPSAGALGYNSSRNETYIYYITASVAASIMFLILGNHNRIVYDGRKLLACLKVPGATIGYSTLGTLAWTNSNFQKLLANKDSEASQQQFIIIFFTVLLISILKYPAIAGEYREQLKIMPTDPEGSNMAEWGSTRKALWDVFKVLHVPVLTAAYWYLMVDGLIHIFTSLGYSDAKTSEFIGISTGVLGAICYFVRISYRAGIICSDVRHTDVDSILITT
jgi:hypothetical protein